MIVSRPVFVPNSPATASLATISTVGGGVAGGAGRVNPTGAQRTPSAMQYVPEVVPSFRTITLELTPALKLVRRTLNQTLPLLIWLTTTRVVPAACTISMGVLVA